jgi:hypothetical protein
MLFPPSARRATLYASYIDIRGEMQQELQTPQGGTPMIRIAVLGCGRIGGMHAANIAAHSRARLAAVQDIPRGSPATS